MKNNIIRTRFAPSPTGYLHIGGARSALFNFLFAKKNKAELILRLDDTDQQRYNPEFEKDIINNLKWLGIEFDAFYKQSARKDIYKEKIQELLDNKKAYISKEKNIKEGQKAEVIRLKNPGTDIAFQDIIRGEIKMNTKELGDFVIAKDMDQPIYHLASAIDDMTMGITHIIRGEDHIANTPRQILILRALGAPEPLFAHIPLILAPDKSKLSKRHGAVSLDAYRQEGYLPEALFNFLALLGWSPQSKHSDGGTNEEILYREQLIDKFTLQGVQRGGAIFNQDKLKWINKEHMKNKDPYVLQEEVKNIFHDYDFKDDEKIEKLLPLIMERIYVWKDLRQMLAENEFDYFFKKPSLDKELLGNTEYIPGVINLLSELKEEDFSQEKIKDKLWDFATVKGRGEVLWPMRFALSGRKKSPDPFSLAEILGKEETIRRLQEI